MRIKNMMIADSVNFVVTLIIAGSSYGFAGLQINNAEIGIAAARILQGNAPWFAICFITNGLDVTAGIDQGKRNVFVFS